MLTLNSWFGIFVTSLLISDVIGLRLTTVRIPTYKFRGESALLECHYELNGQRKVRESKSYGGNLRHHAYQTNYLEPFEEEEKLYSIKWYKDNEEFYRYVPSASQPIKSYKIEGIRVDPNHSDGTKVFLRGLTLKSSGVYRCEISAEAPSFNSVQGAGRMEVIYVPKDGPHISDGGRQIFQNGDTMELNCTSGRSYPATTLQWYLNDEPVTDPDSIIHYPSVQNQHGLITTFLGLSMVVNHRHFIDGTMRINCIENLSGIAWRSGKESIVQWGQPSTDSRFAMLLGAVLLAPALAPAFGTGTTALGCRALLLLLLLIELYARRKHSLGSALAQIGAVDKTV
uniref:Ig-like domain-containing protein n=1 Tax=Anopheles culicifacies TaxID=139723 RepID=A0A182MRR3_9DIPT